MSFFKKEITLDNQSIQGALDECVDSYEKAVKKRKQSELNLRFTLEELLLDYQETYGETEKCTITGQKKGGAVQISLSSHGQNINPLMLESSEAEISRYFLDHLGLSPAYTYVQRTGENLVCFSVPLKPVKNKMLKQIFAAVALAVLSYLLAGRLSTQMQTMLREELVQPIFSKMTSVITTIATPLVFLAVLDGMLGVGSTADLGSIGKKLIRNMFLTYGIAAVAFTLIAPLFYPVNGAGSSSAKGVVGQLLQLVLDIIPDHLLECFVVDNDLQVITLSIFIGVVLLTMGSIQAKAASVIHTLSGIVNKMMLYVCKLLPLLVYLGILNMLFNDLSQIANIYKVALIFASGSAIVIISLLLRVWIAAKVPAGKLFKAQLQTLMINLTTSSQVAAMPENIRCCKDKFGIDGRFVDFALPVSIVTYMPCGAIFLGTAVWGVANISGTPIDLMFMIKVAVVAVIVAIAAPPIPGSAITVLPILLSSSGANMDYFSVAVVLATILGYFLPALNGYCMQLEMLITAKQLGFVDEGKLRQL